MYRICNLLKTKLQLRQIKLLFILFSLAILILSSTSIANAQPLPPANPRLTTLTAGNVLEWQDGGSNGATTFIRYEIGRSTSRGGAYGVIGNTTNLSFTDTTATPGTTYYYVIRDVYNTGTTPWSDELIRFYPFGASTTDAQIYKNEKVIRARWPVYENEIVKTFVGLGTIPGQANIVGFIDVGHATEHQFNGVTLQEGVTYYVTVMVQNTSGFLNSYGTSVCSSRGLNFVMTRDLTDIASSTYFNNALARVMTSANAGSVTHINFGNNQQRRYRMPVTIIEPGIESRFNAPAEISVSGTGIPTTLAAARNEIRVADEWGNEVPCNVTSAGPTTIENFIYDNGTENVTFVPGFSANNGGQAKNATSMSAWATNNGGQRTWVTGVAVDLTGWDEVAINWSNTASNDDRNESYFIVSPNQMGDHNNQERRIFRTRTFGPLTDTLDVSAINGTRFIRAHARRNGRNSTINVFSISLRRAGPTTTQLVLLTNLPRGGSRNYWVHWGGGNAAPANFISNSNDTSQRAWSQYYSRKLLPPGIETDPINSWTKLAVTVGDWYDRGGTWITLPWAFPYFSGNRTNWFLAIKGTLTGVDYRDYSNTWNEFIQNAANRDMISALWLDTAIRDTDPQPQNIGFYTLRKDAGSAADRQGFFWRANRYGVLDDIYMFQTFLYASGDIAHRYEYLTYQGLWVQGTWDNPVNLTHNTVGISHNNNSDYFWTTPLREGIGQTPTSFFQYKNATSFLQGAEEDAGAGRSFAGHIDSHIFDSRASSPNWQTIEYDVAANGGRFIFYLRSGATPEPDSSWTAWTQVATNITVNGSMAVPAAINQRFIQYRCVFIKDATGSNPTLNRVSFICRGIEITRVEATTPDGVTQGQDSIPVTVAIRNFHSTDVAITDLNLTFTLGTYTQTLSAPPLPEVIPSGIEREFTFLVNVDNDSPTGTATVDAVATGTAGVLTFSDLDADSPHAWLVREKAHILITQIDATPTTVNKGQTVLLRMLLENAGGTPLIFDGATMTFSLGNYDPVFLISPAPGFILADGSSMTATFSVTVESDSPSGVAILDGTAIGRNTLSNKITSTTASLITDSWIVQNPAQFVIESVVASDTVYRGQTNIPVFLTVTNIGEALAEWQTSTFMPFFTLGTYDSEIARTAFPINIFGGLSAEAEYWLSVSETSATGTSAVDAGVEGIDTNTLVSIFANNAIFPTTWTIIGEKIKNYKDPALLFESTSFNRPAAGTIDIYAKSSDLAPLKEYTMRWYRPDGTQYDLTTPPVTSDASGTVSHQISIDAAVPYGLWTVKLTNPLNTHVACQNFFEIVAPAEIDIQLELPARVSVGQTFNATSTILNAGGAILRTAEPGTLLKSGPGDANILSGPTPALQDIAGLGSGTFTYQFQATTAGNFSVDGNATGYDGNSDDFLTSATQTSNVCLIQTPPNLSVVSIIESYTTVFRNQQNLSVIMRIRNTGQADAIVEAASLTFSIGSHTQSLNVPATFPVILGGGQTIDLTYTVGVTVNSPTGNVTIGGSFLAYDSNDPTSAFGITGGNGAWTIADVIGICSANSSYNPEQYAFNVGQTVFARFANLPLNTNYRIRFYNIETGGAPVKVSPPLNSGAYGVCDDLWNLVGGSPVRRWRVIVDTGNAGTVGTIFGIQYFDVQNPGNLVATLTLSPSTLFVGETFSARLIATNTVISGSTIASTSAINLIPTALSTGAAIKLSGSSPASASIQAQTAQAYLWDFEATADTTLVGSFSLTASLTYSAFGYDQNTAADVYSNRAISNSIFIYRRDIDIASSTLDHGVLEPGDIGATLTFRVINSGNYDLSSVKWATADLRNEFSDYISKAYLEFSPSPLGAITAGTDKLANCQIQIPFNQASGSYIATMSVYEDLNSNDSRDFFEPAKLFSVEVVVPSAKKLIISNPVIDLGNWPQGQTTNIEQLNFFNAGNLDLDNLKAMQLSASASLTFIDIDPVNPGNLPISAAGSLDISAVIPGGADTGIYIATYTLYDDVNNNNVIDIAEASATFIIKIGIGLKSFTITPAAIDSGPATPTFTVEDIPFTLENTGFLTLSKLTPVISTLVDGANSIASENVAIFLPSQVLSGQILNPTLNIYIPAGTPIGSYSGIISVFEDNNSNGAYDIGEASASFSIMADVRRYHAVQVIPSTIDFGDLSAGTGITVSVLCRNIGNVTLNRLLWDKIGLVSGANTIPAGSYIFQPDENPFAIAPGVIFSRNVTITIPMGQPDGTYMGNATWIYDDDDLNSLRSVSDPQDSFLVTCRIGNHIIDIQEASLSSSGNPYATSSAAIFNVRNSGSLTISNPKATGTALIGPATIPATANIFTPEIVGYILQNQTKQLNWRVSIPANILPGVYTGTVTVWNDSNNDGIINPGEANDTATLNLTVNTSKAIEVMQKPLEMGAKTEGSIFTSTIEIINRGNIDLVSLRGLSANAVTTGGDLIPAASISFQIPSGGALAIGSAMLATVTVNVGIPQSNGLYLANLRIYDDYNPANGIYEPVEESDSFQMRLTIGEKSVTATNLNFAGATPGTTATSALGTINNTSAIQLTRLRYGKGNLVHVDYPAIIIPAASLTFTPTVAALSPINAMSSKLFSAQVTTSNCQLHGNYIGTHTLWEDDDNNGVMHLSNEASATFQTTFTLLPVDSIQILTSPIDMGRIQAGRGSSDNKTSVMVMNTGNTVLNFAGNPFTYSTFQHSSEPDTINTALMLADTPAFVNPCDTVELFVYIDPLPPDQLVGIYNTVATITAMSAFGSPQHSVPLSCEVVPAGPSFASGTVYQEISTYTFDPANPAFTSTRFILSAWVAPGIGSASVGFALVDSDSKVVDLLSLNVPDDTTPSDSFPGGANLISASIVDRIASQDPVFSNWYRVAIAFDYQYDQNIASSAWIMLHNLNADPLNPIDVLFDGVQLERGLTPDQTRPTSYHPGQKIVSPSKSLEIQGQRQYFEW